MVAPDDDHSAGPAHFKCNHHAHSLHAVVTPASLQACISALCIMHSARLLKFTTIEADKNCTCSSESTCILSSTCSAATVILVVSAAGSVPVYIIAKEQKVRVWGTASDLEDLHQIVKLPVGVSNYNYRCPDMRDIALSYQQLLQTCTYDSSEQCSCCELQQSAYTSRTLHFDASSITSCSLGNLHSLS